MNNKYDTIQIIPANSGKTRIFKIHAAAWKFFFWILIIILILSIVFIYKLSEINALIVTSKQIKAQNEMLVKKQKEYEAYFSQLDSIYVMERQIKNILGTYYETDSQKLSTILEKNSFNYTPPSKNRFDAEGRNGIQADPQEKKEREKIPNIIPTVGIISKQYSEEQKHFGIDISAKEGEPVFAAADGIVESVKNIDDLGLNIRINHNNGYVSSYSHLQKFFVKKKTKVKKGQTIGTVGETGNATGPHLHYEILLDNKTIDPELLIEE